MSDKHDSSAVDVPVIDADLMRAQVVNALTAAGADLRQAYPNGYRLSFVRVRPDGAMFLGTCEEHGTRLYDMRLLSEDGTKAKLYRLSPQGELLDFEACDGLVANAIGRYLGATVHQLYLAHVPEAARATHPAPDVLQ